MGGKKKQINKQNKTVSMKETKKKRKKDTKREKNT